MELEKLCFGNSRGKYELEDKNGEWLIELYQLLYVLTAYLEVYKKYPVCKRNVTHSAFLKELSQLYKQLDAIYKEYAKEFGHNGHKDTCKLVVPNFLYKPQKFSIKWYKYPFRDSYMNQDITLTQFEKMIEACIASLK